MDDAKLKLEQMELQQAANYFRSIVATGYDPIDDSDSDSMDETESEGDSYQRWKEMR